MGVGRRIGKKQAAPEPLSQVQLAKLKRKAGLPVDEPTESPQTKRRRTAKQPEKKPEKKSEKKNGAAAKKANGEKPVNPRSKPKKQAQPVEEELSDADSDDDMSVPELGDDFIGSEGSSVYDSAEEEQYERKQMFSDDEDDSDVEEKLTAANIEGLSRKLDAEIAQEEADAEAELKESALQTNIAGDEPGVFDSDEEDQPAVKSKALLAPDLQLLRTRINDNIRILENFAELCEDGRSRAEYTSQLLKDICDYYGYSEFLAEKLFNLFTPREAFEFFEANEKPRPVVIRTNTLRTQRRDLAQALINRGVTLEPVGKWSKVGLQIFDTNVPIGATPEYVAGHYMLQAASSFLPVMALAPRENERVLDMAAAPGGKTTHLAAMMRNTGLVVANDPSKDRARALVANSYRLGAQNVVVANHDARDFPKALGLMFDRVLLDAPCSGTGVISKDANVKTNKTSRDFMMLPHMQKQLILSAIDSIRFDGKGDAGVVVYSTCSVTVEENEQVVQYALNKRPNVRLVETGLPFGREGFTSYRGKRFDPNMSMTRRYYPHTYNVDGFFVAKLKKIGPDGSGPAAKQSSGVAEVDDVVDKAPIVEQESGDEEMDDGFGGFDDEEDKAYIEKGQRNAMRRRGLDPNAKRGDPKKKEAKDQSETETETETKATPEKKEKAEKKQKKAVVTKEKAEETKEAPEAKETPEKKEKTEKKKGKKAKKN
ncbi:related to nucleolar protein [Cephalotrichum gorgonifer]|uniref:Nucleolar protein 2 n=1 Tax=Cephalotrichum gorgonifer TaxID=2041049 RepID=A0AAE8SYH0_9PEZI|nr:related to nucleolar protein [Cephalotrichum gorgonifer]